MIGMIAGVCLRAKSSISKLESSRVGEPVGCPICLKKIMLKQFDIKALMPIIVLIVLAVFLLFYPNFMSLRNFARIAIAASPLMVAIGVTLSLLWGRLTCRWRGVALSAVIFCFAFLFFGGTLASGGWIAIIAALGFGAAYGALNGSSMRMAHPHLSSLQWGLLVLAPQCC